MVGKKRRKKEELSLAENRPGSTNRDLSRADLRTFNELRQNLPEKGVSNENVPPLFRDDQEVLKYQDLRLPRVAHGRMACVTKFIQSNRVRTENLAMFRHSSWACEKLTKFVSERSLIMMISSISLASCSMIQFEHKYYASA